MFCKCKSSRRLMMEMNAHSKVEAPKIDPNDAPQLREKLRKTEALFEPEVHLPRVAQLPFVVGLPPDDAPHTPPNHASTEPKMPTRLLRRSSIAFSGTKTFLIGGAIAAALACIFVFESSPPKIDKVFAPVTASIEMQPVTPAPPPQALPPMIEAQGIPARTEAEREVQAPSLQPTPDLESRPSESKADIAALQPTPDLESRTKESKTDIMALQPTPDQESRPNESKSDMTALQPTPDLESRPSESKADIAALQPTPDLESRPSESRTTDDKSSAMPDMRPVTEAPQLNEQDINGDYATALRLLRPLAERGNRQAQYNLAVMYANGRGVPRDEAEANRWYRKAAEQGDPSAQSLVGSGYLYGRGAPKDFVQAYLWLSLAAHGGDGAAAKVRDGLERFMTAGQISEARKLTRDWKPKRAEAF